MEEPEYLEIKKEHEIRIVGNKIRIEMNNNEIIFTLIKDLSFNKYIKRYKHESFKEEFFFSILFIILYIFQIYFLYLLGFLYQVLLV